jgi:RHS repeat-associated protein
VISLDVNNDHAISPVDALIPINYIIEHGSQPVTVPHRNDEPYRDVSGDNYVSPVDALRVINAINEGFQLPITLNDPGAVANQESIVIGLGQDRGSRTYRFELDATFDDSDTSAALEDTFVVYLVDKDDPSTTLLDRGANGTSIFALSGDRADFVPGLVRYDSKVVEIDLTSLDDKDNATLVFQLLNSDSDNGTHVVVRPVSNEVNPDGLLPPTFFSPKAYAAAGDTLDFDTLTTNSDLEPLVSNVRYDKASGEYRADLQVRNNGVPTGRNVALELTGLPDNVSLRNASGISPGGNPYLSLHDAIPSGGLGHGATSAAVEVTLDVMNQARFSWAVGLWSGAANQGPEFDPIDPITITPGQFKNVTLTATDPDGDAVSFALKPADELPSLTFNSKGSILLSPTPDQLGSFTFDVLASDGASTSTQTISVDVVADPITMTRVSGQVLDTDGTPLADVPIEVGRFQTTTVADGSFTLELPSFTVPTDEFDIPIPVGDPQFDPLSEGRKTILLFRAGYDTSTGTSTSNPRQHQNLVSTFLDASVVYGSDATRAAALRTNDGSGKLKTSSGDLLPLNDDTHFPDGPLENQNDSHAEPATLFVAGDVRANDNPALLSLQTLLVREHNRKAEELKAADSHLTGDEIYQQARRWVEALMQHVTYDEFLPLLLGDDALPAYSGYDSTVDPRISSLFSVAAFRFGHSTSLPELPRLDDSGVSLPGGPLSLRDAFFNPEPITNDGIEPYLRGMAVQQVAEIDPQIIDDLRNFLFGPPGAGGLDLGAIDIQRGRDMGLPSYNQTRRDFGLAAAATFADITSDTDLQNALASVYSSVEDVDLFVGGLTEDHKPGSMVGETFWTILQDQFQRLRDGDRFWYENSQFTAGELDEIRNTSLADLILRDTSITSLPSNIFTVGAAPATPVPGGDAAAQVPTEFRSLDGGNNNPDDAALGQLGGDLLVNYTPGYADGIGTPGGAGLPGARAISNALFAQTTNQLNSRGATNLLAIWGQLVAHDTGLTPGGTDNTIKVHGDSLTGDDAYPFVAERLPLLLDHPAYVGGDNVILRPIYLPQLEVAGGTTIDPNQDTMVEQEVAPGEMASIEVAAGTLENRNGTMFDGTLSITEVPPTLTPASLPDNLRPDLVVTIQPADMVFTTPAPLTLPNRAGYEPGTELDLWSINPITGRFDKVGKGRVSSDGTQIETIEGGVRNSSWHFVVPPERSKDPSKDSRNKKDGQNKCATNSPQIASTCELHSGAVQESHALVSYQSQGVSRQLQLSYDSLRADPRPIVHFGFDNIFQNLDRTVVAKLLVDNAAIVYRVPGYTLRTQQSTDFHDQSYTAHFFGAHAGGGPITDAQDTFEANFSATAGQTLALNALEFDGNDPQSVTVRVEAPDGTSVLDADVTAFSAQQTFAILQTGTYKLKLYAGEILPDDSETIRFRLQDISDFRLKGGEHFWSIPADGGTVDAAIQADLRSLPTGFYTYSLYSGLMQFDETSFTGTYTLSNGEIIHINSINSPFGAGWGLAGVKQLVIASTTALLVDGDGSELVYRTPPGRLNGDGHHLVYDSPAGDFSRLEEIYDDVVSVVDPSTEETTYYRLTTPDHTVTVFDVSGRTISVTDRNGNETQYNYDAKGRLTSIIDPVGLQTTLTYTGDRVTSITDPANRTTELDYDATGDLIRITDPDGAARTFNYDDAHHMTGEIDQAGRHESESYDFAGRVSGVRRKDGSSISVQPVQVQGLYPPDDTIDPFDAPPASTLGPPTATYTDSNGNITTILLDQYGQAISSSDGVGRLASNQYNSHLQVTAAVDARGNETSYAYDAEGNVIYVADALSGSGLDIRGSIDVPGQEVRYALTLDHDRMIHVDTITTDFVFDWSLSDPSGMIAQLQSFADDASSPILSLPAGDYTFVVDAAGDATGTFELQLQDLATGKPLTLDEVTDGILSPATKTDLFAFEGLAGDRFDFQAIDSDSYETWRLIGPDGSELFEGDFFTDQRFAVRQTGTYSLLIEGSSGSLEIGTYSFNLQHAGTVPLTQPGDEIAFGDTVTGSIDTSNEQDYYSFNLASLSNLYFDSLTDDSSLQWSLSGPQGTVVDSRNFASSDAINGFGQSLRLVPGAYTLNVDGIGDATGAYSFRLVDMASAVPITPGTPFSGDLTPSNETDLYRFTASAGDQFFFDQTTSGIDSSSTRWRLIDPYGNDLFGSYGAYLGDDVETLTLSAAGTYTLLLEGAIGEPGNPVYNINVQPMGNNPPQPFTGEPLTLSETIAGSIDIPGATDEYTFNLASDSQLYFDSLTNDYNFHWTLVGPAGTAVSNRYFSDSDWDRSSSDLRLPAGAYQLSIDASGDTTGDYSFRLIDLASATMIDAGMPINGSLMSANATDAYQFTAAAGDRFFFDQTERGQNLAGTEWRLLDPYGNQIFDEDFSDVDALTLPVAGTYTLLVEGSIGDADNPTGLVLDGSYGARSGVIGDDRSSTLEVTLTVPAGTIDFDRYVSSESGYDFLRFFIDDVEQDSWSGDVATAQVSYPVDAGMHTFRWEYSKDSSRSSGDDAAWIDNISFPGGTAESFESGDFSALDWSTSGEAMWNVKPTPPPNPYAFTVYSIADATPVSLNSSWASPQQFTYDTHFNQLTSATDNLGRQTLFDVDPANGNIRSVAQVVGALGGADDVISQFTYTAAGLIDNATDPNGNVTSYDYDDLGRLTSITVARGTPDEASRQFEYDAAGNVTAAIDESGTRTEFEYDAANRLLQITEPDPDGTGSKASPVTNFTYDARGNLLSSVDARNNETQNRYDVLDRLIEVTDSNGQMMTYAYDNDSNLTGTTDSLGHRTQNHYDARNRLVETVDADGGRTRFTYDANDNLTSIVDPVANTTTFTYDSRNRLDSEIDPLGNSISYAYDLANNLVSKADRNGRVTQYAYDDLDRLVAETWVGGGNAINYAYDKGGNLTSIADTNSVLAFTYDSRDRVKTVDNAGTPGAPNVVLNYDYDGVGNVLSVADTIDGSAGADTSYVYDVLNRMTQITQTGSGLADKRVDLAFNPLGQFASIDRYFDLAGTQLVVGTAYAYDALNRLTELTHSTGSETAAFYNFTYDSTSRITQVEDVDGVTNYAYDARDQLIAADHSDPVNPDETYQYDANGNRISSSLHGSGYVTGAGNRLLSDCIYDYAYDNEGNLIRRTEIATGDYREFTWDYRNRLTSVTDKTADGTPTQRVTFSYDGLDRRISKAVDMAPEDAVDAAITHFVYDREDVILDFLDGDGSGPNSPTLQERYLHGPATDQVLAQDDGAGSVQWDLADHLGTVRDLVDNAGVAVNHIQYDSFGNVTSQTDETVDTRYLFTGREFDGETGLYYYRARSYDASIGRFLSEDPIRFGTFVENLYGYVESSPVAQIDPTGLQSCPSNVNKKDIVDKIIQKIPDKKLKKVAEEAKKVKDSLDKPGTRDAITAGKQTTGKKSRPKEGLAPDTTLGLPTGAQYSKGNNTITVDGTSQSVTASHTYGPFSTSATAGADGSGSVTGVYQSGDTTVVMSFSKGGEGGVSGMAAIGRSF